jgi:hypothetical protein
MFVDLGKQVSSVEKVLQRQWDLLYTKMRKLTISRNYDMLEKLLKEHYVMSQLLLEEMILYLIYGFVMVTCTVSPLSRFTAHLLSVYRTVNRN